MRASAWFIPSAVEASAIKAVLAEQGQRVMHPVYSPGEETLFWPFFLYGGLVVLGVAALVFVSYLLGQRHEAPGRNIPYESGITPTRSARLRYGVHFYTVGIFFILFDVEAAFLFAWAVSFRELGWVGYVEAVLFIVVLFLGLVYIWRRGGLDWSPSRRRARGERQR